MDNLLFYRKSIEKVKKKLLFFLKPLVKSILYYLRETIGKGYGLDQQIGNKSM